MQRYVIPLANVGSADVSAVGGKAAALGALRQAGFPVPRGLCVTTYAFELALNSYQHRIGAIVQDRDLTDPETARQTARELAAVMASLTVPTEAWQEIQEVMGSSLTGAPLLAVRSTATAEDLEGVSFAGQYETVLGIRTEADLEQALLACWRSFYRANALVARAKAGLTHGSDAMAVLVQELVEAECAGVCFSMNPVQNHRENSLVEAVWGLGLGCVDGAVGTDAVWISRTAFAVEARRTVVKEEQILPGKRGEPERKPVPAERQRAACLPDPWAVKIAEMALAAEHFFGRAQDVEWAIADGRLWLLQSRPITSLPPEVTVLPPFPVEWESDDERRFAWRLQRVFNGHALLPMEADVHEAEWEAWMDAVYYHGDAEVFRTKMVQGRRYGTLQPSSLQPGDQKARQSMVSDLAARLTVQEVTPWEQVAPEVQAAARRLAAFHAARADAGAWAEHIEEAFGVFRRNWFAHWLMVWPWNKMSDHFSDLLARVSGLEAEEAKRVAAQLVEGEENELTRMIDRLFALGRTAAAVPAVRQIVSARDAMQLAALTDLPEASDFLDLWSHFLEQYGDRQGSGFGSPAGILSPTWREEPGSILDLIGPYMAEDAVSPADRRRASQSLRAAKTEEFCSGCSDSEAMAEFRRALALHRKLQRDLENHNHWIDQMAGGLLRRALLGAGRLLAARGDLEEPKDVFWLRRPEVSHALRADSAPQLREAVTQRRAENAERAGLYYPPVIGVPAGKLPRRPPLSDDVARSAPSEGRRIVGYAAGPGIRRGRARVVAMAERMPALKPGDILVAENAGPNWTPVFPILGGIVLDRGSITQHAATTAREYGIPAVLGTGNGTRRIPDRAAILIDGARGTVEILEEP